MDEVTAVATATESIRQLFLSLDTRVTCPKCTARFSLEEGFARKALEELEHSTAGALEAVRQTERADADRQAQRLAQREANLKAREQQIESRIAQEAQVRAQELFAGTRQVLEQQLA